MDLREVHEEVQNYVALVDLVLGTGVVLEVHVVLEGRSGGKVR